MIAHGQQKRSIIVFSGYNFRAVIALCRQMNRMKISFGVIALDKGDPIFSTSYKDKVLAVRSSESLEMNELFPLILEVKQKLGMNKSVILPTSEFLNHFLIKNSQLLRKNGIGIPLPGEEKYKLISNKESFMKLCEKNGLVIPPEVAPSRENLPMVFKPRVNIYEGKSLYPALIFDEESLDSFKRHHDQSLYNCQKYIDGKSFYLLYHVKRGKYLCEIQENLLQQSDGKSILWARRKTGIKPEISQKYGDLLVDLKFNGLVMIEVKELDGTDYLIEANPRPWGPMQLMLNTPLITNYLRYLSGLKNSKVLEKCSYSYIWLGGIIEELLARKKLSWYTKEKFERIKIFKSMIFNDVYLKMDSIAYFFKELKKRRAK